MEREREGERVAESGVQERRQERRAEVERETEGETVGSSSFFPANLTNSSRIAEKPENSLETGSIHRKMACKRSIQARRAGSLVTE